jgi:phosphatidylinositol glycan class V
VGFLKYWTLSNLPLFFLAAPMLICLCLASRSALQGQLWAKPTRGSGGSARQTRLRQSCVTRLAIPQALLAIMAATSYHVQIINRISSGYPLWYWYLASFAWSDRRMFAVALRGVVIYGLVQAVLFGSFLPPA